MRISIRLIDGNKKKFNDEKTSAATDTHCRHTTTNCSAQPIGRAGLGRSLAGVAPSKPAGGMDACLFERVLRCQVNVSASADHSSRGILHNVVCLSVIMKPR